MTLNKLDFDKFCEKHTIPINKRTMVLKQFIETRDYHIQYKDELDEPTSKMHSECPTSEVILTQNILATYGEIKNLDPTENPPATYNFRADNRFIFYKDALRLMNIKTWGLMSPFLKYFNLLDGPTYRYKRLQCKNCNSRKVIKVGLNTSGNQRYKCSQCGRAVKRELNSKFHANINMQCPYLDCEKYDTHRFGMTQANKQRYKCRSCNRTFII